MADPMVLKKGKKMVLPGSSFTGRLSWLPKGGVGESPDLDLCIIREHDNGLAEIVFWGNLDWRRPDLGVNVDPDTGEENPWIVTPELDVVYKGDNRTGGETTDASGQKVAPIPGEYVDLEFDKAPSSVIRYSALVGIYDENGEGLTLGVAEDIACVVKDNGRGTELKTELAVEHGFDTTTCIAQWDRDPQNPSRWSMTAVHEGYAEGMQTVAQTRFHVVFPPHWSS